MVNFLKSFMFSFHIQANKLHNSASQYDVVKLYRGNTEQRWHHQAWGTQGVGASLASTLEQQSLFKNWLGADQGFNGNWFYFDIHIHHESSENGCFFKSIDQLLCHLGQYIYRY